MSTNIDDQINALFQVIKKQREAIKEFETTGAIKRGWATNCSYRGTLSETVNIQTASIDRCVQAVANLFSYCQALESANAILELTFTETKIDGFLPSDWIEDFKKRVAVIQLREKQEKLTSLEKRLNAIVSPEQRRALELAAIMSEMGE